MPLTKGDKKWIETLLTEKIDQLQGHVVDLSYLKKAVLEGLETRTVRLTKSVWNNIDKEAKTQISKRRKHVTAANG